MKHFHIVDIDCLKINAQAPLCVYSKEIADPSLTVTNLMKAP